MRHALIAASLLFTVTACEKKVTATPDSVSVSAGGTNVTATTPTGTTPTGTTPTGTTPTGTTPTGTTPTTDTGTTPPAETSGKPAVVQGEAEIKGAMDKDKLKSAVTSLESQLLTCYNSALERTPGFTGQVSVRFIVGGHGKILSADLAEPLKDNALAQCVIAAVKGAKLPKPSNGKDTIVTQPFSLELQ
jgi:hypothetical protein